MVYIFKKALFLLNAVSLRFSPSAPSSDVISVVPTFPLPDISALPIFADNVIPSASGFVPALLVLNFRKANDFTPPALLVHFKLLDLSGCTDSALSAGLTPAPSSTPTPTPAPGVSLSTLSAARLRASAIDACARVVARAHELAAEDPSRAWLGAMRETDLDGYLWSLAKEGELRKLPRVVETGTVFY